MSASSPFSRGRGRGRYRDNSSTSSSLFDRESPALGSLLDENSKSVDQLDMEMRTTGAGRGRARPDRRVKRPDAQMYVPPSRRQQQQKEIIQEEITPGSQKSSKSPGKTNSGVYKYVNPHPKSVQEKSMSPENLENSVNNQFIETSKMDETCQAGNMKGVQPVDVYAFSDGDKQKKSVFVSQFDECTHLNEIDAPFESLPKIIKKQKTSHQQEYSSIEITGDGDAELISFTGTKEKKTIHSGDLEANKNINAVCLSDTQLPNRNECMKVSQDRIKCDTEIDAGIDGVLFLAEKISSHRNMGISCTSHRPALEFSNKSEHSEQQKVTYTDITIDDQFSQSAKLDISTMSDELVTDCETIDTTKTDANNIMLDDHSIYNTVADTEKVLLDGAMLETTVLDADRVALYGETIDTIMPDKDKVLLAGETMDAISKNVLDGMMIDNTTSVENKNVLDSEMIDTTLTVMDMVIPGCETIDNTEYLFHSYSENVKKKGVKNSLLDFSSSTVSDLEKCACKEKESNTSQVIHLQDLMEPISVDLKITNDQDSFGIHAFFSNHLNEKEGSDHILTVSSNHDPEQYSKCEPVINKEIQLQDTFSDCIRQSLEVKPREQSEAEWKNHPAHEEKPTEDYHKVGRKTTEIENESCTDEKGKIQAGGQIGGRTDLVSGVQEKAVCGNIERSDNQMEPISEDEIDEDSWDAIYGEDGECLDSKAMDELTKAVGKVKIEKAKINYLEYSLREPHMDYASYSHIIEIYDFPKEFITRDLIAAFQSFVAKGFDIKWVDDTHALGVFSSAIAAQSALSMIHPLLKVCPLSEASQQSKLKAKRCTEFLQPYKPRPESSAAVARRLVTGALGLAPPRISKEKREQERKQLQEARAKKRHEKKEKDDMWEGTYGKCSMDATPS